MVGDCLARIKSFARQLPLRKIALAAGVVVLSAAALAVAGWGGALAYQSYKISKAERQLTSIVDHIRNLKDSDAYVTRGSFLDVTQQFIQSGIFDADMIVAGKKWPIDAYKGDIRVYTTAGGPSLFRVAFYGVNEEQCTRTADDIINQSELEPARLIVACGMPYDLSPTKRDVPAIQQLCADIPRAPCKAVAFDFDLTKQKKAEE